MNNNIIKGLRAISAYFHCCKHGHQQLRKRAVWKGNEANREGLFLEH